MSKKVNKNDEWKRIFTKTLKPLHKQFTNKAVTRLLKKTERSYNSLIARSKKYKVEYKITLNDLRELVNQNYNKTCKYCNRILRVNNYQIDHIIPISKGGNSNKDNLQMICGTCNKIKGSLSCYHFLLLLNWLSLQDKEFSENIRRRLAGVKRV